MNVIIPITPENNIWSFINPFGFEVWIIWIISIPIFILSMGAADYIANRDINWDTVVGFVLRNVFSEHLKRMPDKKSYQKIYVLVWTLCCFVLVMAFAGNLTAMITRPKFDMKINNFKDILYQDEIGLVVQDELIRGGELEQYPADSPKRRALEQAQIIPLASLVTGCFDNDTYYSRKHASYCDIQSILEILSEDFTNSGKCNIELPRAASLNDQEEMGLGCR